MTRTTWKRSSVRGFTEFFYPLMAPLLRSRKLAVMFLLAIGGLTIAATMLAATRSVPLKMLPFDNKNELMLRAGFRSRHDAGALGRRRAGFRAISANRAGGFGFHQLRRRGRSDGFQRTGPALLSPPGGQRRADPGQSGGQEESHDAEPRDRAAHSRRSDGHRRAGTR